MPIIRSDQKMRVIVLSLLVLNVLPRSRAYVDNFTLVSLRTETVPHITRMTICEEFLEKSECEGMFVNGLEHTRKAIKLNAAFNCIDYESIADQKMSCNRFSKTIIYQKKNRLSKEIGTYYPGLERARIRGKTVKVSPHSKSTKIGFVDDDALYLNLTGGKTDRMTDLCLNISENTGFFCPGLQTVLYRSKQEGLEEIDPLTGISYRLGSKSGSTRPIYIDEMHRFDYLKIREELDYNNLTQTMPRYRNLYEFHFNRTPVPELLEASRAQYVTMSEEKKITINVLDEICAWLAEKVMMIKIVTIFALFLVALNVVSRFKKRRIRSKKGKPDNQEARSDPREESFD